MRRVMIGIACLVAGIGAAIAQVPTAATAPSPPHVRFEAMPDGSDFARNYPESARRDGIPGLANLCCTIRPDRTLSCVVAAEWPEEQGFGEASLIVAREFRVSPEGYADAQTRGDLSWRRTIRWELNGPSARQARQMQEASARLREAVCPVVAP